LPAFSGANGRGEPVPLDSLKNQWLLISVADSACGEACERHLYLQRQIREMLGREKDRLDWVWLRTGEASLTEVPGAGHAAAVVLQVDADALAGWLQPAPGQRLEDHLYVVDPLGNWMMRFPADVDPKKARRDLTACCGPPRSGTRPAAERRLACHSTTQITWIPSPCTTWPRSPASCCWAWSWPWGPMAWVWLRSRRAEPAQRLRLLTLVTLFLTFDLVLFGAFTRLTDSGLGCPDWPGCYGSASPVGARARFRPPRRPCPPDRSPSPRPGSK
jgi:hypothetical protein